MRRSTSDTNAPFLQIYHQILMIFREALKLREQILWKNWILLNFLKIDKFSIFSSFERLLGELGRQISA